MSGLRLFGTVRGARKMSKKNTILIYVGSDDGKWHVKQPSFVTEDWKSLADSVESLLADHFKRFEHRQGRGEWLFDGGQSAESVRRFATALECVLPDSYTVLVNPPGRAREDLDGDEEYNKKSDLFPRPEGEKRNAAASALLAALEDIRRERLKLSADIRQLRRMKKKDQRLAREERELEEALEKLGIEP